MRNENGPTPLSPDELAAETGTALPDKEVISILDLNADLDIALDAAAPIDLAVAANANVAAPIDAAASANLLSVGSTAQALSDQGVIIDQGIAANATADSAQDSTIDQANDTVRGPEAQTGAVAAGPPPAIPAFRTGVTAAGAADPALLPDRTLPDAGAVPDDRGIAARRQPAQRQRRPGRRPRHRRADRRCRRRQRQRRRAD